MNKREFEKKGFLKQKKFLVRIQFLAIPGGMAESRRHSKDKIKNRAEASSSWILKPKYK